MWVCMENVKGHYQCACFPFRKGFDSGCLSLAFAPDASLFVYSSPEVDTTVPSIKIIAVRLIVRITLDALAKGHIHEIHPPGVKPAAGESLWHPAAYYTFNCMPEN
jgi:hypothetical protein